MITNTALLFFHKVRKMTQVPGSDYGKFGSSYAIFAYARYWTIGEKPDGEEGTFGYRDCSHTPSETMDNSQYGDVESDPYYAQSSDYKTKSGY